MATVPNLKAVVENVYKNGSFDLSTKAGCGKFTEACAIALHRVDKEFGHLLKSAGRNHVVDAQGKRHAVDAVLYKATGQSVDLIGNSESPEAKPSWGVDIPRYSASDWYAPVMQEEPPPPPPPSDLPDSDVPMLNAIYTLLLEIRDRQDRALKPV